MRTYRKLLAVIALSGVCLAASGPSEGAVKSAKKRKKHAAAEAQQVQRCEACEAIDQLKEQINAQQAQIQAQQMQIDQLKTAQAPQPANADEQARAQAAAAKQAADAAAAAAAEARANANAVKSEISDLKESNVTAVQAVQETQKRVTDLENPAALHYKNVTITPGGFLAAETLWRQRAENNDIISSYNGIPFSSSQVGNQTEFRGTARQSRLSLLAQGKAGNVNLTGYYEMDFLGAAPTANENQSSSFNIRQRQLFGEARWNGWTVTGGQTWSLLTTNKKGIFARGEWNPAQIDAQYIVGYTFARLMTMRVAKTMDGGLTTVAFSVENPATLALGNKPANVIWNGPGTGSLGNGVNYSINLAPDVIGKVAFDPSFGHFEIKAVGRFFRDRIIGTDNTNLTLGGGVGAAAIVPVAHKKVNLIGEALVGRGVGRYGDSSNVDVTFRPDGGLSAIENLHALGGLEASPTKKLMLYFYAGDEYQARDFTPGTAFGYGNPAAVDNAPCFVKDSNVCNAQMRNLVQGVAGFWYDLYKGGFGTLRYGAQYSYTHKSTWTDAAGLAPVANENMAFTSLRYYLP